MPRRPDWRSPSAAENLNQLDRAGFAWEFLRRNPNYREDYRRIVEGAGRTGPAAAEVGERWGFVFACNPKLAAPDAPVIWRPELVPHAVLLVPAPDGFAKARRLASSGQPPELATYQDAGDGHVIVPDPEGAHRVRLEGLRPGRPLAALVPLDEDVPLRVAGLLRFQRRLDGRPAGPLPRAWAIAAGLRRRLVLMVRALDGHQAEASYREIAHALYGPGAVARYPWKTSSVRGRTIRLVKDAIATMTGGYRRLLRGRR